MKKLILVIMTALVACIYSDDIEYSVTLVPDTSTVILSQAYRKPTVWETWTAETAVTNGTVLKYGSNYYTVMTTGTTSTNAPTVTVDSGVITDGTAELIWVRGGRKKALVTQEGNGQIWFHTGSVATTNGGEYAYLQGQQYITTSDTAISVISDTALKLNIRDQ